MISGNLFTRDYLLEGIARTEQWNALGVDHSKALHEGLLQLAARLTEIAKPNEAQTEKNFIYPALQLLGWTDVEVQQTLSAKGRKQVPDALLFADTPSRTRAVAENEQWRRFQHGLAILEAKRWGRALDRADKREAQEEGVPSTQTLYDILEEKQPVTPMMALRLGKLCGNGPDLWLNLQKRYDLQRAKQALGEKLNAIPTLDVA